MKKSIVFIGLAITFLFAFSAMISQNSVNLYSLNQNQIKIGNQIWSGENVNIDRFQNGDRIPQITNSKAWLEAGQQEKPAWCYYDFDPANGAKYGKLYNWYAVNDPRGFAPKGWHIPSENEFETLIGYLGKSESGNKLKSSNNWENNGNGSNSFQFNALASGEIDSEGEFSGLRKHTQYWTTTEDPYRTEWGNINNLNSKALFLSFKNEDAKVISTLKMYGVSVRLLKD